MEFDVLPFDLKVRLVHNHKLGRGLGDLLHGDELVIIHVDCIAHAAISAAFDILIIWSPMCSPTL